MNVLRKKLEKEPGIPDHIKNNVKVWQSLHVVVCEMLSSLTQTMWEPGRVTLDFGDLKTLKLRVQDAGLKFGYGDSNDTCTLLTHFDKRFAANVTLRSLDLSDDTVMDDYTPELLDLLLFKPVADVLGEEIIKLFDVLRRSATGGMRQVKSGLRLAEFEFPRGQGLWNEITFFVKEVKIGASEEPASDIDIETEEGGMPSEGETDSGLNDLAFKIILPQNVLQHLMSKLTSDAAGAVKKGDSPWSKHMYQSLETAKVPVRAIIESCTMTVADCTRLEIGEIIELPGVSLQSIGLETEMTDGSVNIATAALGIYKSNRAVKLTSDLDPEFFNSSVMDAATG